MNLVQYNGYVVWYVDTDGLVLFSTTTVVDTVLSTHAVAPRRRMMT